MVSAVGDPSRAGPERIAAAMRAMLERGPVARVVVAGGVTAPPQLAYMVSFPRLSLTLAGEDEVELERDGESRVERLAGGEALFVPPNCWNRPTWASSASVLNFLFGKRQTGVSLLRQRAGSQVPAGIVKHHVPSPAGPEAAMLDALLQLAQRDPCSRAVPLLVESLLHGYLHLLEHQPAVPPRAGKADATFQNICLYLQESFSFDITRESVAEHFRLSPNHVSRLFRRQGFMRFNDYLTLVRIDRAKYLLRHHELTIDEVAANCGYNETAYFCRVFKKRAKLTPTHFRLRYREGSLG